MNLKTNIFSIRILLLTLFQPFLLSANETIGNLESRLERAENDSLKIELFLLMGDHFEHTDYDATLHFYNQALDLVNNRLSKSMDQNEEETFKNLKVKVLRYIAIHNKSWGKYDEAFQAYKILGQAYLEIDDLEGHISSVISQGNVFYYQGIYPRAMEFYQEALILSKQNNFYGLVANLKLNYGMSYYLLGNYIQSLSYLQRSLELYDSLGIENHMGSIYMGMGNIYSELSDFDNSMKNYNMALEHYRKYPDNNALANLQISIGALYYDFQLNHKAEEHYLKALDYAILMKSARMKAHTMLNLGQVNIRKLEFDKALSYFNQAMILADETNNMHIKANILRNIAILYIAKSDYNMAYQNARESLQIGEYIESVVVQSQAWRVLSEIREKQGIFQDALLYFQNFKTLNDSLLDLEKQRKLTEMDALFQSEKQIQAMEFKQLQLDTSQAELKQKRLLANTFIAAFVLVVIFGIASLIFYNRRIRTDRLVIKQNKIIQETGGKNDQLTKQLEIQNKRIMQIEKEIAVHEKNLYNNLTFAEELNNFMLPGFHVLPATFNGHAFMFTNTRLQQEKTSFLWVKQHEDNFVISLAMCNLPGIKGSLVNLYLNLLLEKFSHSIYLKEPAIMTENLNEQIQLLSNRMEIDSSQINISLLWINRSNQKIVYAGKQIRLYLAIARMRKDLSHKPRFEYQELQKLSTDKSNNNGDKQTRNSKTTRVQLKRSDRLYLIGHCKNNHTGEVETDDHLFIENEIIPLLNQNRDHEISYHKTLLKDYMVSREETDELPDNMNIIGIEL